MQPHDWLRQYYYYFLIKIEYIFALLYFSLVIVV